MSNQMVLVVGEVFVDTHLDISGSAGPITRLGGIFHAARGFAALGINYTLAYYAPDYLDDDVIKYSTILNARECHKLGNIIHAPNVMLIGESTEAGGQRYVNILKNQAEYIEAVPLDEIILKTSTTDVLLFPGRYDVEKAIKSLNCFPGKVHIDANYDSDILFDVINRKIDSLILSTSSFLFQGLCNGMVSDLIERLNAFDISRLLLKENRGGAVCYLPDRDEYVESMSYPVPTLHSVGVGDVYNSVFVSRVFADDLTKQMCFAALCAANYAQTLDYDHFKDDVRLNRENIDMLRDLAGIRLPWEKRKSINVYLAAPDFPNVDTKLLDALDNSLRYHNFSPRCPVKENGLVTETSTEKEKIEIYLKDSALMEECNLLIAVLLNNDPGTL